MLAQQLLVGMRFQISPSLVAGVGRVRDHWLDTLCGTNRPQVWGFRLEAWGQGCVDKGLGFSGSTKTSFAPAERLCVHRIAALVGGAGS